MLRNIVKLPAILEEKENQNDINFVDHTKSGRNSKSPIGLKKLVKTVFNNSPTNFKDIYAFDDFVLVKPKPLRKIK